MNNFFRNQLIRFSILVIIVAIGHFLLIRNVLPEIYGQSQPWRIYLLLAPITMLGLWFVYAQFEKDETSVVKSFMLMTVVKMIGSMIFLSPWLILQDEFTRPIVYQFFALYFPILFAEVAFLVKMLGLPTSKTEKNEKNH